MIVIGIGVNSLIRILLLESPVAMDAKDVSSMVMLGVAVATFIWTIYLFVRDKRIIMIEQDLKVVHDRWIKCEEESRILVEKLDEMKCQKRISDSKEPSGY